MWLLKTWNNKVQRICFVHMQETKLNKGNFMGKNIVAYNAQEIRPYNLAIPLVLKVMILFKILLLIMLLFLTCLCLELYRWAQKKSLNNNHLQRTVKTALTSIEMYWQAVLTALILAGYLEFIYCCQRPCLWGDMNTLARALLRQRPPNA